MSIKRGAGAPCCGFRPIWLLEVDGCLGTKVGANSSMFLVAPVNRRDDVQVQLRRPAFSRVSELGIRYLPYSELKNHREAIARFGSGLKPLVEIARLL